MSSANLSLKDDFGNSLRVALENPSTTDKSGFIFEAEKMIKELSNASDPYYETTGILNSLTENLASSRHTMSNMQKFKKTKKSRKLLSDLETSYNNLP